MRFYKIFEAFFWPLSFRLKFSSTPATPSKGSHTLLNLISSRLLTFSPPESLSINVWPRIKRDEENFPHSCVNTRSRKHFACHEFKNEQKQTWAKPESRATSQQQKENERPESQKKMLSVDFQTHSIQVALREPRNFSQKFLRKKNYSRFLSHTRKRIENIFAEVKTSGTTNRSSEREKKAATFGWHTRRGRSSFFCIDHSHDLACLQLFERKIPLGGEHKAKRFGAW